MPVPPPAAGSYAEPPEPGLSVSFKVTFTGNGSRSLKQKWSSHQLVDAAATLSPPNSTTGIHAALPAQVSSLCCDFICHSNFSAMNAPVEIDLTGDDSNDAVQLVPSAMSAAGRGGGVVGGGHVQRRLGPGGAALAAAAGTGTTTVSRGGAAAPSRGVGSHAAALFSARPARPPVVEHVIMDAPASLVRTVVGRALSPESKLQVFCFLGVFEWLGGPGPWGAAAWLSGSPHSLTPSRTLAIPANSRLHPAHV
jgi:hypothetical protein